MLSGLKKFWNWVGQTDFGPYTNLPGRVPAKIRLADPSFQEILPPEKPFILTTS
jgi:hypothetical protein